MNTSAPPNPYTHHRFPAEIISHGVWLYFRFCLSYRDVEELLFARGISVTYKTIQKWCLKFGQDYANQLRRCRPRPGDKWHLEMCQTQPIKMSWCPLSLVRQMPSHLRGGIKRAHELDVHLLFCDDNFADQASGDGLPCSKRELCQMVPQPWAKGGRLVDHLLPVDALWPRVRLLPTFLLDLRHRGREFLPPRLACTQGHHLGLIGIQHAWVLPFAPLPSLQQWRGVRLQPGEVLWCGFRPRLMQVRHHLWIPP
jgi:hypothetical protein